MKIFFIKSFQFIVFIYFLFLSNELLSELINPNPKMYTLEFTQYNFTQCTNTKLTQVANIFLKPVYYSMSLMSNTFKNLGNSVQNIIKFLNTFFCYNRTSQ